jgi:hypothetical protein
MAMPVAAVTVPAAAAYTGVSHALPTFANRWAIGSNASVTWPCVGEIHAAPTCVAPDSGA